MTSAIPASAPEPSDDIAPDLTACVAELRARRIVALTGAGCSTESGIPDYRGEGTRRRARNPMQHRAFIGDPLARRRYWARSMIGWEKFSRARPNRAHVALAELEAADRLAGIITQNVDRLHHAAGSRRVVELHGALAEVRCLGCPRIERREALQRRLVELNPGFAELAAEAAPDGDADLADELVRDLRVAACEACAGVLKPNVVFFGDSVPRVTVDAAFELLDAAEALLVVGSSLAVFSGYRFVRRARERHVPIVLVNVGPTRADEVCTVKLELAAGRALPAIVQSVLGRVSAAI